MRKKFIKSAGYVMAVILAGIFAIGCDNVKGQEFSKFGISVTLTNKWTVSTDNDKQFTVSLPGSDDPITYFDIFKVTGAPSDGTNIENVTNQDEMFAKCVAHSVGFNEVNYPDSPASVDAPQMHLGETATFAYNFCYLNTETAHGGTMFIVMQTPDKIGWFKIEINGGANFSAEKALETAKTIKVNFA